MREWFTYNLSDFSSETRLLFIFKVLFVTVVITAVLTVVVGNNKTSSLKSSKQIVESRASYECWFFFVISLEYKNLLLLLSLSDEVMKEVVNKIKLDSGEPKEDSGSKFMPSFFADNKKRVLCHTFVQKLNWIWVDTFTLCHLSDLFFFTFHSLEKMVKETTTGSEKEIRALYFSKRVIPLKRHCS